MNASMHQVTIIESKVPNLNFWIKAVNEIL